jgi:hypothetical protein
VAAEDKGLEATTDNFILYSDGKLPTRLRLGIAKDKRNDFKAKYMQVLAPYATADEGKLVQALVSSAQ